MPILASEIFKEGDRKSKQNAQLLDGLLYYREYMAIVKQILSKLGTRDLQ